MRNITDNYYQLMNKVYESTTQFVFTAVALGVRNQPTDPESKLGMNLTTRFHGLILKELNKRNNWFIGVQ